MILETKTYFALMAHIWVGYFAWAEHNNLIHIAFLFSVIVTFCYYLAIDLIDVNERNILREKEPEETNGGKNE